MKKNFLLFASCLAALFMFGATPLCAQTTGSFDVNLSFNGQPRATSLYVPTTYNAANPCRLMVCLHGAGDNNTNYRNALINSLGFQNQFANTIFICPDGGSDAAKDFYTPAGDEAIVDSCIAFVRSQYAIDTTTMILQGFSLGGRSSLKYGLDHPTKFKGLFLNTPALQGVKDALNNTWFNYSNASQLPICVTHGSTDPFYAGPIDTAVYKLILSDAKLSMHRIAGMGHTIPSFAQMPGVATFFDTTTKIPYDIDVVSATTPVRSCQSAYSINCLFRNTGVQPVTSAQFQYTVNGTPQTTNWTGNLTSFQHGTLSIPVTASAGISPITVKILTINGTITDTSLANNQQQTSFENVATPLALPLTEGFEATTFPAGWLTQTSGDYIDVWELDNTVSFSGSSSMFSFNTPLAFEKAGRREAMLTPVLNFSGTTQPELTFDVAYNCLKYTPPYVVDTTVFADTLEVAVSPDCGNSWQVVYKMAGANLATFSQPILNPLSIAACIQSPTSGNDWRHETVNLSSVAGNNDVVVRISYISGNGGWINLDNVSITASPNGIDDEQLLNKNIAIYPNPARDLVTISSTEPVIRYSVMDINGKLIERSDPGNGQRTKFTITTSAWQAGLYLVQLETAKGNVTSKLMIEK